MRRLYSSIKSTLLEEVKDPKNDWLDKESIDAISKKIDSFKLSFPKKLELNEAFTFSQVSY